MRCKVLVSSQLAAAVPSEGAALLRDLLFQPHIVLAVPQLVESLSPLLSAVDPRGAEVRLHSTHHSAGRMRHRAVSVATIVCCFLSTSPSAPWPVPADEEMCPVCEGVLSLLPGCNRGCGRSRRGWAVLCVLL